MKKTVFRKGIFILMALAILLSSCAEKAKPKIAETSKESVTLPEKQTTAILTTAESAEPQLPSESQPQGTDAADSEQSDLTIANVQPGILYEDETVKITVDGMETVMDYPEILFTFENKSDKVIRFLCDYVIVNGIVQPTRVGAITKAHGIEQDRIAFNEYGELDKIKVNHIFSVEIDMTIVDDASWEELYTLPRMTVPMKQEEVNIPPQNEGRLLADNEETRITLIDIAQPEDYITGHLLIENKGNEEITATTEKIVINGFERTDDMFYVDIPVGCKGVLEINLLTLQLTARHGIESLKDLSVSIGLSSSSRWDFMLIEDLPLYP